MHWTGIKHETKTEVKHAHVLIAYCYIESVAVWDLIVDDGL